MSETEINPDEVNDLHEAAKPSNAKGGTSQISGEKMKILENENGFLEAVKSKKQNKKISFFYLGPKNNWKTIYNKKIQSKLFLTFKASLKELKYI